MSGSSASADVDRLSEGVAAEARWAEVELCDRFEGRIRVLAARRGVARQRIDVVVQETLMGVVVALREGRLEDDSKLAAFVYATARNVISNIRRRRKLTAYPQAIEDPDAFQAAGPDPLVDLIDREQRRRVLDCLQRLSTDDREILELAYYQGMPPREIAEELGIARNVARQRKWRALRRFEEMWLETHGS